MDRIIQYAGFSKINLFTARNRQIGNGELDKGQYDLFSEVAYPHGAAMMVKREVIEKVGMMPELYFLYYEEFDWTESIKKGGYRIGYEPKAMVYHKESISIGKQNPLKIYYLNRNRIVFMKRNNSLFNFLLFLIYYTLIALPNNLLKAENNSIRMNILKGYRDSFSYLKII